MLIPTQTPEYKRLLSRLLEESKDRSLPGWVEKEREAMHAETCAIRAEKGKPPVTLEEVHRVEDMAVGHADYCTKFAFYLWELTQNP